MRIRASSFCLALILGFASVSAQAIPILWTLDSVTFVDGGTATGSFVYEADTITFSMINVTTTAGGGFLGASYTDDHPSFGTATQPVFISGLGGVLSDETLLALGLGVRQ